MSADAKPVDLVAARTRADALDEYDFNASAKTIRDMANELERWRTLGAALNAGARGALDGDRDAARAVVRATIESMRALLPPA